MTRPTPRILDLAGELILLSDAIDGARLISDQTASNDINSDHDRLSVPHSLATMPVTIRERLRRLSRAPQGDVDPLELLAAHNDTSGRSGDDHRSHAVYMAPWSAANRAKHYQRELSRETHQLRQESKTARSPGDDS